MPVRESMQSQLTLPAVRIASLMGNQETVGSYRGRVGGEIGGH